MCCSWGMGASTAAASVSSCANVVHASGCTVPAGCQKLQSCRRVCRSRGASSSSQASAASAHPLPAATLRLPAQRAHAGGAPCSGLLPVVHLPCELSVAREVAGIDELMQAISAAPEHPWLQQSWRRRLYNMRCCCAIINKLL